MVFTLFRTKPETIQSRVSAREAFTLWETLKEMYIGAERAKIWANDTHDTDLMVITKQFNKILQGNITSLEEQLRLHAIPSPDKDRYAVNFPKNSQAVTDEFIAQELFICLQETIEEILRHFRTSFTNDSIRIFYKKLVLQRISLLNKMVPYLKFKGWISTPPLYQNVPQNVHERISTIEVANLWDELTFRYDNINTSEVMRSFAYDGDFKAILTAGIDTLKEQAATLEKELEYFGVPLPKRPGNLTQIPDNTEILHDDHLYRTLILGLKGASSFHNQPVKECTLNDRVRKIFIDFLMDEMDLLDKLYKFGKVKGWLSEPPMYGQ